MVERHLTGRGKHQTISQTQRTFFLPSTGLCSGSPNFPSLSDPAARTGVFQKSQMDASIWRSCFSMPFPPPRVLLRRMTLSSTCLLKPESWSTTLPLLPFTCRSLPHLDRQPSVAAGPCLLPCTPYPAAPSPGEPQLTIHLSSSAHSYLWALYEGLLTLLRASFPGILQTPL